MTLSRIQSRRNQTSTWTMKKTRGDQENRYCTTIAMMSPCRKHWYGGSKMAVVITVAARSLAHLGGEEGGS